MRLAVDWANYTPVPNALQLECLKENGYERVIVGVSYGVVAGLQLSACEQAGLAVEAFAFVDFDSHWTQPLDKALAVIAPHPKVRRLWLDCEGPTLRIGPRAVVARIHEAIAYVRGKRPDLELGIYTGAWWWIPETADSRQFAHMPLWMANYVQNPAIPPNGQPGLCGGWQHANIWQYAGTIDTCGLNTDRNVILEEDALTPEQMAELKAEIVRQGNETRLYVFGRFVSLIGWLQTNVVAKLAK